MNSSSLKLLKALREGVTEPQALMKITGLQKSQLYDNVKNLIGEDYIEKTDSKIIFKQNAKSVLLRDIASKYNIEILLHDSNELIFASMTSPVTLKGIQQATNLSRPTIERSIAELQTIGAIVKQGNEVSINPQNEKLYLFAKALRTEKERKNTETYAEILFQNPFVTLKRVPKGKPAEGELTAFSMFTEFGMEYHTIHDYYVKQESPLRLEDILVHAVLAAAKDKDKNAMVMAVIFYLKNRDGMNSLSTRSTARQYGILGTWLDIETYIRENNEIKKTEYLPPRQEFIEKAKLYDIPSELYTLPVAYPQLFDEIGNILQNSTSAYLIGGENMRIKGLKARTKDCDIVVIDDASFSAIVSALKNIGYASIAENNLSEDDKRLHTSAILTHLSRSRMDIFKHEIGRLLYLSSRMINRAEVRIHNKLRLGILQNEDVFLLKGIAGREGDVDDMYRLAQTTNFQWEIVWSELIKQEHETGKDFSTGFLSTLDYLKELTKVEPPFMKSLIRRVVDKQIFRLIRTVGKVRLKDVINDITFHDISEKLVRNRIDYLEKKRYLKKLKGDGDDVYLASGKSGVLSEAGIPSTISPSNYDDTINSVTETCSRLGASEKVKKRAVEIVHTLNDQLSLAGRKPGATAAAAVYIASVLEGREYRVKDVAKAADVNPISVYSNYKRIKLILHL